MQQWDDWTRRLAVFGWAAAEATVWPLMPEALLVPLAAYCPAEWWRLAVVSMLGSSAGGVASYVAGRSQRSELSVGRSWLVRPAMIGAADAWLANEGPLGIWHQPLSGVPFKVFAQVAGARQVPLAAFLACAAIARGLRFLVVCAAAALAGRRCARQVRERGALLVVLWALIFAAGLGRTVRTWQR